MTAEPAVGKKLALGVGGRSKKPGRTAMLTDLCMLDELAVRFLTSAGGRNYALGVRERLLVSDEHEV